FVRFFFFIHSAPTSFYTLSLHDALPILPGMLRLGGPGSRPGVWALTWATLLPPFRTYPSMISGGGMEGHLNTFPRGGLPCIPSRSEEHTSELQSQSNLVCRLLLEKKKNK